jgi:competence protein ComEC
VHVLKVAHHGSRTSSSDLSLQALKPMVAVITVGRRNRYHHPHPAALGRLRGHSIPVYATSDCGHVELRLAHSRFEVRTVHSCSTR